MQNIINSRKHTLKIPIDVVVPESQDPEAVGGEVLIALGIPPRMRIEIVLATINLNDDTMFEADEIHNES